MAIQPMNSFCLCSCSFGVHFPWTGQSRVSGQEKSQQQPSSKETFREYLNRNFQIVKLKFHPGKQVLRAAECVHQLRAKKHATGSTYPAKISSLQNFDYSHPDAHDLQTFSSQLLKILASGRPEAIYKKETFKKKKISPLTWTPFTNTQSFNFLSVTALFTNWNSMSLTGNLDPK